MGEMEERERLSGSRIWERDLNETWGYMGGGHIRQKKEQEQRLQKAMSFIGL